MAIASAVRARLSLHWLYGVRVRNLSRPLYRFLIAGAQADPQTDHMKMVNATAILLLVLCLRARADDFGLINALPDRMTALKKEFHTLADTGNTANMFQATDRFNVGLKQMMRDLIKGYYKDKPTSLKVLDKYFQDLDKLVKDEVALDNPTGEAQGSVARLSAFGQTTEYLTERVKSMVDSITLDKTDFDSEGWEKRWDEAVKTGD